jgi:surface protein
MQANEVTNTLVGKVCCSPAMVVDTQAMIPSRPSDHGRPTDRPIAVVLDLCLYRVVTDRCRGQVLPFGVRQMIKDYAWVSFDNETLRAAVQLWCSDRVTAYGRYGEINDWDVSKVTDMTGLFAESAFNDRIDRSDVRNVTSMKAMFFNAAVFNQPLDTWDVSHMRKMTAMFRTASSFNQPLSSWDVSHVTDMRSMFSVAKAFNQPLSTWNVSQVTNMCLTFYGAVSFNQPMDMWDVSQVTNMSHMFSGATAFNLLLDMWTVCNVTDMHFMFSNATSFNQPLDTWRVSPGTDMWCMFTSAGCCPSIRKIS